MKFTIEKFACKILNIKKYNLFVNFNANKVLVTDVYIGMEGKLIDQNFYLIVKFYLGEVQPWIAALFLTYFCNNTSKTWHDNEPPAVTLVNEI